MTEMIKKMRSGKAVDRSAWSEFRALINHGQGPAHGKMATERVVALRGFDAMAKDKPKRLARIVRESSVLGYAELVAYGRDV